MLVVLEEESLRSLLDADRSVVAVVVEKYPIAIALLLWWWSLLRLLLLLLCIEESDCIRITRDWDCSFLLVFVAVKVGYYDR